MDRSLFSEVHWGETGLRSNSWTSSATSDLEDVFSMAKTSSRTVYFSASADFKKVSFVRNSDSMKVVSSETRSETSRLADGSLSNPDDARELLYYWERSRRGRVASVYAVFYVEHNFSEMNLAAINSLLLSTSPSRLTEWSMIALLRASFSAKHMLPGWAPFLMAVKQELKGNDRAERLLTGLED